MNHSIRAKCSHCGIPLNHADDEPCNRCGATGKDIHITVEEKINVRDEFAIQSTSGKTNRTTIHADSSNPTDTVKIQKLIISFVEKGVNDLALFIDSLVKQFDTKLNGDGFVKSRNFQFLTP
jgi:hypothetical protein